MNIVNVIPISRGVGKETLSYFSAQDIPDGSIVKVPLRNKVVPALVVSSSPVSDLKTELRSADFQMKKIGRTKISSLFTTEFIESAREIARLSVGSIGAVLSSLTSKVLLENAEKIKNLKKPDLSSQKNFDQDLSNTESSVIQASEDERLANYKSLIREQFARKRSVFFCLPTIQDTKRIFETLPKGIEEYTYVFNSSITSKELISKWNKAINENHPILIIATGSFLCIPRNDIGILVVERENSTGYKAQVRPYIDVRTFAEIFAKKIKARLIFGDMLLRTETLWRASNSEFMDLSPLKFRSVSTASVTTVDMKKYKTLDEPEFKIIGTELENLIKKTKENNGHMFLYSARRGLSPMTVCGDCGTSVICRRCGAPIVLHKVGNQNIFICHRCGEKRDSSERCRNCGSWNLTTLGIGIELINEVISNVYGDVKIFRIDKDSIKTHRQALNIASDFYNTPGSLLLGTEMALNYLERPLENGGIATLDSLFSIPDFRINEKIMNIILRIRSITQKELIIQTRSRDQKIFDYAANGNLSGFYREEIDMRKKLNYPPFSKIIKLTTKGNTQDIQKGVDLIENIFKKENPTVFSSSVDEAKIYTAHALIRIESAEWPSDEILNKLRSLPPTIAVNVDPESLL